MHSVTFNGLVLHLNSSYSSTARTLTTLNVIQLIWTHLSSFEGLTLRLPSSNISFIQIYSCSGWISLKAMTHTDLLKEVDRMMRIMRKWRRVRISWRFYSFLKYRPKHWRLAILSQLQLANIRKYWFFNFSRREVEAVNGLLFHHPSRISRFSLKKWNYLTLINNKIHEVVRMGPFELQVEQFVRISENFKSESFSVVKITFHFVNPDFQKSINLFLLIGSFSFSWLLIAFNSLIILLFAIRVSAFRIAQSACIQLNMVLTSLLFMKSRFLL